MRIEVGMRFSPQWQGHLEYSDKIYEVLSITRNCNCSHPKVWLLKTHSHTPTHIHIRAKRVDAIEPGDSYFGFLNEELQDIYDPQNDYLQIIQSPNPVQLTIF